MHSDVTFFFLVALAIAGQLGDCYTTERGLAGGLAEGNGVARFITNRIGSTGLTLLKCIGFAQVFPILVYIKAGVTLGVVAASVPAAIGVVATVLNYRLLKAHKISL